MTTTKDTLVQPAMLDGLAQVDKLVQEEGKRGYAWLLSPLWLCVLVALLIRIWLTLRTHGTLDGDEALLGIQAQHILQGERPIYFYGIPYFGSLEAYVAAVLFALFGPSVAALRAEATGFSLILVAVTWWLASLLAQAAQLPRKAKRWFPTIAALFAALPPLYDSLVEMRTGGGWIESFVLMLLLLVCIYRVISRWHAKASRKELALRWAGVGFVVGFGMWIYPLFIVAILASVLWVLIDRLAEIYRLQHMQVRAWYDESLPLSRALSASAFLSASVQSLKDLLLVVFALPACALGFTPGIIWGASHHWENIAFLFAQGGGWTLHRLHTVARVGIEYTACVAPRVIGGATPREDMLLTVIHAPLLLIGVLCTLGTVALVVGSLRWQTSILVRARQLAALPTLFAACSAFLYCTGSASASILHSCTDDFGGHYAAPLVLVLPFFFATAFTLCSLFIAEKKVSQPGESVIAARPSTLPWHQRPAVLFGVLLVVVLAYFGGQATTYGFTNADLAFQSPYCVIAPANYAPIIAYMQREHIRYAWATNLLGYPIAFETNNAMILADPLPLIHPQIAINRIPAYTEAVARADRPSFLVFVKQGDPHPSILQTLDAEHVSYTTALFPSQPGVDVLVVTPLSRTVSPFSSPRFDIFYCATR